MLYLTESSQRSYGDDSVSLPILWLWNGGSERLGLMPKLTQPGSRKAGFESRLPACRALVLVCC